jgi:hypothetical protein
MPVTQFAVTELYEYLNGFGGYKEYVAVTEQSKYGFADIFNPGVRP